LGGDFVDAVALFEACLETGKTPKLVLLELNPTLVFADKTAFSAALAGYFEHAMLRYKVFPPLFFTGPLKLDGLRWDPRLFSNRAVWRVANQAGLFYSRMERRPGTLRSPTRRRMKWTVV
jgi:hypothetical protein